MTEGFSSVEEVAFVPLDDLLSIEGFEEDVAHELRERARSFLSVRDQEFDRKRVELGVADELTTITGLKPAILAALGEHGVKTLDDLADLAGDELLEIAPDGSLTEERANEIIMAARAHWFEGEESVAAGGPDTTTDTDTPSDRCRGGDQRRLTRDDRTLENVWPTPPGTSTGGAASPAERSRTRAMLLRFVIDPQGQVVPDVDERLPGRGYMGERKPADVEEGLREELVCEGRARSGDCSGGPCRQG